LSICFCPLASGSSGNSIYISSGETSVLVDAGVSGVSVERALQTINKNCSEISAIFITHEHSDHMSGAGILSRRYCIPIYATEGTWNGIKNNHSLRNTLGKIIPDNERVVISESELKIGDFVVKAFDIPHDATEPVGYTFFSNGYKIAIATDIGEPNDVIKENLRDSDAFLIESNHDIEMLINGSYPQRLKNRILSSKGHMSNAVAGQLLCEVFSKRLKHVFLGHLSEENNRPLIAFDTVSRILKANGVNTNCENGLRLSVAERYSASTAVKFD